MSARPRKRLAAAAETRWGAARLTLGALAVLCLASATTLVLLGSRLTFFNDEWYVLLLRRGVSADTLLEPHNGHLAVVPVAIYKVLVAIFGLDQQVPFRVTLAAVTVSLGVLVFAFVRERCGDVLALLAAAIVLFLGPAWQDLLWSFQIGLVGSLVTGIGVLLALERGTRRADLAACALLVLSIGLSNLGTSFIIAAAIVVLMRRRLADAWIPGVPAALFAAWWLAYGQDAETGFSFTNVARTPSYVLDSIAAALASLTGLGTNIQGTVDLLAWGRPLLLLAAVGIAAWLLRGGRLSPGALPIAGAALSWWVLLGINFIPNWREPDTSRYQLISGTFLILLGAELFRPVRLGPRALAVASALAVVIVGANLGALKGGYDFFRGESEIARADLGALDIGRGHVAPKFRLLQPIAGSIYLTGVFAGPYYRERDAHGSPAYSPSEIAAAPPVARNAADVVLASAYGLHLETVVEAPTRGGERCRRLGPIPGQGAQAIAVAAGTVSLANLDAVPARVGLRRFGDGLPVDLGDLPPRGSALVRIPADGALRRWQLETTGAEVEVCET
jgi:hypothetical protein